MAASTTASAATTAGSGSGPPGSGSGPPGSFLPSDAPAAHVSLTVAADAHMMRIPRSYLGFSTEYWTLPTDELHVQAYRRMVSLVHVPGDGPLILRIGGDSSDHTF